MALVLCKDPDTCIVTKRELDEVGRPDKVALRTGDAISANLSTAFVAFVGVACSLLVLVFNWTYVTFAACTVFGVLCLAVTAYYLRRWGLGKVYRAEFKRLMAKFETVISRWFDGPADMTICDKWTIRASCNKPGCKRPILDMGYINFEDLHTLSLWIDGPRGEVIHLAKAKGEPPQNVRGKEQLAGFKLPEDREMSVMMGAIQHKRGEGEGDNEVTSKPPTGKKA